MTVRDWGVFALIAERRIARAVFGPAAFGDAA